MIFPFGLRYAYFKPVHATLVLLLLCSAVYALELFGVADPDRWGLMREGGQPERLVTHAFLHGPPWHLVLNMLALIVFGQLVNAAVGSGLFLLVCAVVTFSSSALELALDERLIVIPSVGFSGILSGLALIGCLWLPRVKIRFIVWYLFMFGFAEFTAWSVGATWLASDLFMTLFTDWRAERTAYLGHLGGFGGGLICFLVMRHFRVAELTGFLVETLTDKTRKRFIRRLRFLKSSAPEADETSYRISTCLRCGHEALLMEPMGDKPLKCLGCGRASREVRSREDAGFKVRRRRCAAALGVLGVLGFGVAWYFMGGPSVPDYLKR